MVRLTSLACFLNWSWSNWSRCFDMHLTTTAPTSFRSRFSLFASFSAWLSCLRFFRRASFASRRFCSSSLSLSSSGAGATAAAARAASAAAEAFAIIAATSRSRCCAMRCGFGRETGLGGSTSFGASLGVGAGAGLRSLKSSFVASYS